MKMFIIITLAWTLIGVVCFIYWWTREFDLTISDLLPVFMIGMCLGPIAYFVGWTIHTPNKPHILIRRRP